MALALIGPTRFALFCRPDKAFTPPSGTGLPDGATLIRPRTSDKRHPAIFMRLFSLSRAKNLPAQSTPHRHKLLYRPG
ncbi:hypothetical protein EGK65_11025 [Citrobacter farmeri]|nr:hypothetical protein EGK65_11025 [Citrobacter farmeri]